MTVINRDAIIAYSPVQMFNLVNAIEDYPQFVPACKSTQVISRTEDEIRATLEFAQGGFHKSFSTCNRLQGNKLIEIRLIDGPFKQLEGFWRFEEIPEGCRISLDLEFEFNNKLLSMMFSPVFHPVADKLVDVFCQRAHALYGG
ncbi:MAG: type II toxin-antitoxin system RatA family toxin [Gammaproteobacteria bacterium]